MSDRPTITMELPISKTKVVLKEWLTGREYEAVQKSIYEAVKTQADPQTGIKMSEVDMTKLAELNHNGIKAYVVSVGEKKEDLLNVILDLQQQDYQAVVDKINELSKKK